MNLIKLGQTNLGLGLDQTCGETQFPAPFSPSNTPALVVEIFQLRRHRSSENWRSVILATFLFKV